jgi:hypothetical protein
MHCKYKIKYPNVEQKKFWNSLENHQSFLYFPSNASSRMAIKNQDTFALNKITKHQALKCALQRKIL